MHGICWMATWKVCKGEGEVYTHTQKDTRHMSMKVEYLYSTEGTANPDTRRVKTEYCHYSHKQVTTKRTSKTEQNTSKSEFLQKKKIPQYLFWPRHVNVWLLHISVKHSDTEAGGTFKTAMQRLFTFNRNFQQQSDPKHVYTRVHLAESTPKCHQDQISFFLIVLDFFSGPRLNTYLKHGLSDSCLFLLMELSDKVYQSLISLLWKSIEVSNKQMM